jgi:hypothetical protein
MNDLEILTTSRGWGANPQDYNRLNLLTFGVDGSGMLVLGHAQTILAMVRYRFEILKPGILRIMFVDAQSNELVFEGGQLSQQLVDAERSMPRDLNYVLRLGDFRGEMNMGSEQGPFRYHFRAALTLDGPPYSESTVLRFGHRPGVSDYTYFGHPPVAESGSISATGQNAG